MNFKMISKLAIDNMVKRRHIYLPYLLAISLMMALQYIMLSLIQNHYVRTRHSSLVDLVTAAAFFSIVLALIFILYANGFITKQRRQEFALYRLLGLANRHLSLLVAIEQVASMVIVGIGANVMGYAFGHLMFALINRMVKDTGAGMMDYPFDWRASLVLWGMMLLIFVCLWIVNTHKIVKVLPVELLSQRKAGEPEPRSHWLLLVIGLIATGYGYYLALTIQGVVAAIFSFLMAVACVILGTFALMVSFSVIFLKGLRKRKDYYYQPKHFLTISGLMYRMKANGVSLAFLAVLCTGVMLTLGTTLTLFLGLDSITQNIIPRDYAVTLLSDEAHPYTQEPLSQVQPLLQQSITELEAQDIVYHSELLIAALVDHQTITALTQTNHGSGTTTDATINDYAYINAMTLATFNATNHTTEQLSDHEILLAANDNRLKNQTHLTLMGQEVTIKYVDKSYLPSNLVGNKLLIVVKDETDLERLRQFYPNILRQQVSLAPYNHTVAFNLADAHLSTEQVQAMMRSEYPIEVETRQGLIHDQYAINGGFLFLGIIVGTVLVIGIVLMLYFKQLSEGMDDQTKYRTMKQVGLPDDLVKSTIKQQIIWIFSLPLIIAVLHTFIAHRLMYNLLGAFGIEDFSLFIKGYGGVLLIFIFIYFIIYKLTAHIYYQMVNQSESY